ncbi:ATP-binding protein [Ilumatobacter coccineus]|uniref:ATP-binding protein n=1 Tax=Ilumatobacter coccineus TaxID=467094 RepID=UPI000346D879|nr:ATP-binding protein [Ilumatobacter coccineus]
MDNAGFVVRVPTQESELRSIRAQVRAFVSTHDGSDDVADDIELAVSELATNVMQHSAADAVTVAMERLDGRWLVDVYDADEIPPLDEVSAPPTDSITGRGLFIVQAVMDDVSILHVDERTIIRCIKHDA